MRRARPRRARTEEGAHLKPCRIFLSRDGSYLRACCSMRFKKLAAFIGVESVLHSVASILILEQHHLRDVLRSRLFFRGPKLAS